MTEIQSGTVLKSRYKIIQTLGKGGMGEVYLAEDQSLANQVAVKANHNLSAHTSAQFIREARLLASLKHPNLPRVIDYFIEDDSQYLVMDYVPGNDLRTLVEGKNAIMVPLVIKWAEQLGNAINYLHNQNPPIFHRDVKPANIKVTPNGEVVLVDFGIAKTGDPSQETQTGAWGYTPGFAPPEQVSGLRTGPYSDQFSLAATLYYLLAGTPPVDSAQRMMGSAVLTPIKELRKETPDHVSVAIMKAMSIKPEERFTTVADFIHALTSPTPIPDPSNTQRTVIGRARTAQPPVVPPATPPAAAEALPVPHRKSPLGLILGIIGVLVLAGGFFLLKSMGIIGAKTATTVPTPFVLVVTGEPQNTPPPIETAAATETPASAATDTPEPTATATLPAYIPIGGGGRLAFVSNRQADGYFQVWLMGVVQDTDGNLLGVNPQQLTFDEGNKSNPSWSPDGTKLLYSGLSTQVASNKKPFADDIWMLDLTQPDAAPVDLTN
ncbi:MAG TPA: protein kinase, partial [Anaerolineaceae bacterium]|nr:protein kinase [Anaerolineaceae bacterium]